MTFSWAKATAYPAIDGISPNAPQPDYAMDQGIPNINEDTHNCICPQCSNKGLRIQYIGDLEKRVGYALVWCDNCQHGIHISRTFIPEGVHALSFGASSEEIARYVPAFKLIS